MVQCEPTAIGPGVHVSVKLREGCNGGDHQHSPQENNLSGHALDIDYGTNDHPVFVFFTNRPRPTDQQPLLPLGRWFARDELVRV
ncbi:MAG: hypothetical protein IT306_21640 [Chloroflexi bacterium]|nr:hypothetical protein [Chloroflexota bacterium]